MTIDAARRFLLRVGSDEPLRAALAALPGRPEQHAHLERCGYDFHDEELDEALRLLLFACTEAERAEALYSAAAFWALLALPAPPPRRRPRGRGTGGGPAGGDDSSDAGGGAGPGRGSTP